MIERTRSVAAFFHECIVQSLKSRKLRTSELTESYLVQLLTDLASPRRRPFGPGRQTLVELLQKANEASGADQARLFRELGDCALVWSGVFRDRLLHQGMSLSYYNTVGGSAYRQAGHLHKVLRASPIDELCLELSAKFPHLSDALDDAATLGVPANDAGLLNLFSRFQRNRRPWMLKVLKDGGIDPS